MKSKATFRGVVIPEAKTTLVRKVLQRPQRPVPPAEQKVRVAREVAGRGGKGVTVISGLALPDAELETLAGELKRACGAGGALREGRIEIQGEHRDRLVAELVKRGYAAKRAGG